MAQRDLVIEIAKEIWKIGGISPEHGNALMDLLGEQAYLRVMRIAAGHREETAEQKFDPDARIKA